MVVQTAGGRPSADQRRQVTEVWRAADDPPKFALMTESRLIRGMVETLKVFLGDTVAAFAFDDFEGSAVHVRLGAQDAAMLREAASRLRGQLG